MCKICKNETIVKQIGKIMYHYCEKCGFLSKDEDHILSSEDELLRYQQHNNNTNDSYVKYQENFYKEIAPFLGENVLDFGCGDNHVLADIINKNNKKSDYYDLYFYPNKNYKKHLYDAIILEEVIEHLKDPIDIINQLISNLKVGGKFIIRTMMIPTDVFTSNWWYLRDSTHISFFDIKTFETICELLDLKIIYFNDKDLIILQKA